MALFGSKVEKAAASDADEQLSELEEIRKIKKEMAFEQRVMVKMAASRGLKPEDAAEECRQEDRRVAAKILAVEEEKRRKAEEIATHKVLHQFTCDLVKSGLIRIRVGDRELKDLSPNYKEVSCPYCGAIFSDAHDWLDKMGRAFQYMSKLDKDAATMFSGYGARFDNVECSGQGTCAPIFVSGGCRACGNHKGGHTIVVMQVSCL